MPASPSDAKLQRWIDLVVALLTRHHGVAFEQLRREVPGYADGNDESVRRTFERDKDELIALGVPITLNGQDDDGEYRYIIRSTQFYLPYLALLSERGLQQPRHVDEYGYRALAEHPFTDAEMALLGDAAARVRTLGDPLLAADADHATAKFLLDVTPEVLAPTPGVVIAQPRAAAAPKTLKLLGEALQRRKQATIRYYGIGRDTTEERTVQPYGLTFTNGHWYLHAHDPAQDGLRRFRVSRIEAVALNTRAPGTPDYEIASAFDLAAVAEPIPAWQLGEEAVTLVTVRIAGARAHALATRALGTPTATDPQLVEFSVRRTEPFLRWILGMAGDAVPVSPAAIVTEFAALCDATVAAYGGATS